MYIVPQEVKCLKCGHKMKYGPHNKHPAPVIDGDPLCPKCYNEFMKKHVGVMEYTEDKFNKA